MPTFRADAEERPEELFDEVDVEIVPEEDDDGMAFEVGPDGELGLLSEMPLEEGGEEPGWNANLALTMSESELNKLADDLIMHIEADDRSRDEKLTSYRDSLDLLGLKVEKRSVPWKDACGAYHPLLAEALIRYISEAILETFPPTGPAATSIIGAETPELLKRDARVKSEMNYQCTKKMPENRPELEMTLWRQALAGSCFRKVYFDPVLKRPRAIMVPMEDFIVQYGTSDLHTCPRYTHRFEEKINEVRKKIAVKHYRSYEPVPGIPEVSDVQDKTDELAGQERSYDEHDDLLMLECYADLDLVGHESPDGVALPYIVTIDKTTGTVVSVYRNHSKATPYVKRRTYFVPWTYLPGFGIYGTGLCEILGGTADSATSLLRQLVDAGTLSNIPSGFKSRALRIKGDDTPLAPGELRDIDLPPGMMKGSIEWVPTKDPNVVFLQALQAMVDEGRRIGSVADMKIGDSSQGTPVGTTLAVIERNLRVITAVQARNNISMAQELAALKDIVATEMDDAYEYTTDVPASRRQDFADTNIIPVADPSGSTRAQRIMQFTAAEQIASRQPHLVDMAKLFQDMLREIGLPRAEEYVPLQDDFEPQDPVTENMRIIMMRPVKAFINQDHAAHIAAHTAAAQDPLIQQMIGQSPNAAAIAAAAAAHIQEHVAYKYRSDMQQALGFALPDPEAVLPPEGEAAISRFVAEAAQKVLANSQNIAAQQKAQQEAQDPLIQLKKMEIMLEEKKIALESATEEKKMQINLEIAELKAKVEMMRIRADQEELGFKTAVETADKKADRESRERVASEQAKARAKQQSARKKSASKT